MFGRQGVFWKDIGPPSELPLDSRTDGSSDAHKLNNGLSKPLSSYSTSTTSNSRSLGCRRSCCQ